MGCLPKRGSIRTWATCPLKSQLVGFRVEVERLSGQAEDGAMRVDLIDVTELIEQHTSLCRCVASSAGQSTRCQRCEHRRPRIVGGEHELHAQLREAHIPGVTEARHDADGLDLEVADTDGGADHQFAA